MSTGLVVQVAHDLGPFVRAHADECDERRTLVPEVVAALCTTDLFRLAVPACYGGPEVDPLTALEVFEVLATHDAAVAWCAMISSTTSSLSWYLPPDRAIEIFGSAQATGGAFAPNGTASRKDGGWVVRGRWAWGSGTQHSAWVTGGTLTDTGEFHLMLFPRHEVSFLDTWYTSGLRGTGSTDFEVHDVFVPDGRSVQPLGAEPVPPARLAHYPLFSFLAAGVAAVHLGIARRAIDELVELARQKTPMMARSKLAEHVPAQLAIARAEAALASARAFLHDEVAAVWRLVETGEPVAVHKRARVRLACSNAAVQSATAVDLCHAAAGGSAVFSSSAISRCHRDVHAATAHLMVSDRNLLSFARLAVGLETDTSML